MEKQWQHIDNDWIVDVIIILKFCPCRFSSFLSACLVLSWNSWDQRISDVIDFLPLLTRIFSMTQTNFRQSIGKCWFWHINFVLLLLPLTLHLHFFSAIIPFCHIFLFSATSSSCLRSVFLLSYFSSVLFCRAKAFLWFLLNIRIYKIYSHIRLEHNAQQYNSAYNSAGLIWQSDVQILNIDLKAIQGSQ